jgi:DNA-directed RNA polymerase III subunit RPC6
MARSKKLLYNFLFSPASNHTLKIPSFAAAVWNSEESDPSEDNSSHKKSKRKRSKGRYGSDSDQEQEQAKKKQKKNDTDSESSSDHDTSRKKRKKKKKKKRDLSSDDSDSEIDYRKNGKSKSMKGSQSESMRFDDLDTSAGNSVYRALKESTTPFAWTESPCGVCPSFEFCKPGGPVNPQECSYYGDWLSGGTVSNEIEE